MELNLIKKQSTRQLLSALNSLQIIEALEVVELSTYTEILFRVSKDGLPLWTSLIKKLLYANNNFRVSKRYLLKEGELAFAWTASIASENLDADIERVTTFILNSVSRTTPNSQNTSKSVFKKTPNKKLVKPIFNKGETTAWEIELTGLSNNRNQPRLKQDGTLSTKGAYSKGEQGQREWSKAILYQRGRV